jgi:DNA-binding protein WhiA
MKKLGTALWDELLELPPTDAASELSGFVAVLPANANGESTLVDTRRLKVARRMLKLCRALGKNNFGSLELDKNKGKALFRLSAEFYSAHARPAAKKWAWLRGAWGGCGALYTPHHGYYMAFRAPGGRNCGAQVDSILRGASITPGVRANRGGAEYMIRDLEAIVTVLSRMGLVKTSLLLEETAVIRSVRGAANKMVNCDSANIASTLAAARAQMALVDHIDMNGLWNELPPRIAEMARARRENPSASLRELGQLLSKPVSKSTVEYRWRKLETIIGCKI